MKIFLVYLVLNSPQDTRYNYGLGYIAAVLKKNGHDVNYFSLKDKNDLNLFYKNARYRKPEVIGFSSTTSQFYYLNEIAKEVKSFSDALIVCGGIHPTLKPDCIYENQFLDCIVRGEGEFAMLDLADTLNKKDSIYNVDNLWIKNSNGIIKNNMRPLIKDLDALPFPDKESLDYQNVIDESGGLNRFIFSRGCAFDCAYCSNKALSDLYGKTGSYLRFISPERAIEQIESDKERYEFDKICFDDDIITINRKWFYDFFAIYKQRIKNKFICNIRPGTATEEMVKILKECGIERAVVGVEHGNENFRKNILNRNITNREIITTFEILKSHGIEHTAQVMVGLPLENKKLFLDTVKLCRRINVKPDNIISIFYPYPQTKLNRVCEERGWMPEKRYVRERMEPVLSYPSFTSKQIISCKRIFSILLKYKFIPVGIPFFAARVIYKITRFFDNKFGDGKSKHNNPRT